MIYLQITADSGQCGNLIGDSTKLLGYFFIINKNIFRALHLGFRLNK